MSDIETPQIYLITPPELDLAVFPDQLAACLDNHEIACVRLALSGRDEAAIGKTADVLREVTHSRDVALVIETHLGMVTRHGLDGAHLIDGARSVARARKELGPDAIIGAYCGNSRHDGMTAGEIGADYVSFGPIGATALGDGQQAGLSLFEWWSEMIEVPVVAEGALDVALIAQFAPVTDFIAIGDEIWGDDAPVEALAALLAAIGNT